MSRRTSDMKALQKAHVYLTPFLIFTILTSFGFPLTGAALGLAVGIIASARRFGASIPPVFVAAQILGLLVVLQVVFITPATTETSALAILFAFLAGGAAISVAMRRPWTAELSAAEVGEFAGSPAFIRANQFFSGMWAAIFAWFAFANWQELAPIYRWAPLIVGGLVTILGPKILMTIGVKRGLFEDPRTK